MLDLSTRPGAGDGCEPSSVLRASDWIRLAAAPAFAVMALITGAFGDPSDMLCQATQGASPLSGMAPMYLLMSAVHLPPWLQLIAGQGSA